MSIEGTDDRPGINHRLNNVTKKYDTGWINRSDWTNVHMGSNTGLNVDSNVEHNLGANLSELRVTVLVSTDGTDANSFIPAFQALTYGYTPYYIDRNNIKIQTHVNGLVYDLDNGANQNISSNNWYYKIVIGKI